ncbi:peptidoglycan editing factor PgeF [Pollutimonas harenae]|uniref:Purine nucleoside phosphorylase n=1 Tax=Pollutimonas harenae TaxID=657015 RepID=A0A853H946_9BURK|nr:peptidoglycan editing factor PgeF [Pollutimonas harenae]NYT86564.1 peptidoglycan editing factor PgeF [Pollutimonas harenae]TEA69695.1 peptidoglycan editing factor PgeF [Pollutimonas harenae]
MEHLIPALPTVSGQPWPGINYFCTTRQGGSSTGPWASFNLGAHAGDAADTVDNNRQRLRAILPGNPVWLKQVHGAQVFDADAVDEGGQGGGIPVADAAITLQANRVLAIMTADCLPVVLASVDGQALGVAHAGWRGLAAGVLENTLDALRSRLPGNTAWRAWIGPAISQSCFEVGADVYDAFVGADPGSAVYFIPHNTDGKWLADLPGLARHRLLKANVSTIELSDQCTFNQADMYYSYRRDAATGRMATLAWRTG